VPSDFFGKTRYSNHSGAALLLAIFATVILTVLAVGLINVVNVELMASRVSLDRLQASYLAKAGFNLARSVLMYKDDTPALDGPEDVWFALDQEEPLEIGEGWCKIAVIDACSLININTADEQILTTITGKPELAEAIIAWRKDHGLVRSLDELLQVEGVTKEMLSSWVKLITTDSWERNVSINKEGQERKRSNINGDPAKLVRDLQLPERQAQRLTQIIAGYRGSGEEFPSVGVFLMIIKRYVDLNSMKQIVDNISLNDKAYVSGRVNLNTASREVLLALPGATKEFVDALMERRQTTGGSLRSLGDLVDLPGMKDGASVSDNFFALVDVACTKSSTFIIEAYSGLEGKTVNRDILAIVRRQPGPIAPMIAGYRETVLPTYITVENIQ